MFRWINRWRKPSTPIVIERACRVCGCTDVAACNLNGLPCCWVEEDLCSVCALQPFVRDKDSLAWLTMAMVRLVADSKTGRPLALQQPNRFVYKPVPASHGGVTVALDEADRACQVALAVYGDDYECQELLLRIADRVGEAKRKLMRSP